MSFLLRFVTRSAAGREIVRTREVAGDLLTIGRDPASDIRLTDLSVTKQYAAIRRTGPRQLLIEALAGSPIEVDGHSRRRAHIDAGDGGEIVIGATRVSLALGEGEAIAVTIDEQAPQEAATDTSRGFSLAGKVPSKRLLVWAGIVLVLALFLARPIWSFTHPAPRLTDAQMAGSYTHNQSSWSSGPLSRAHASLQHDCRACHVNAFVAVPDTACRTCHAQTHDHADPTRLKLARVPATGFAGFKERFAIRFGLDPGRCVDCHVEHQGATNMPPTSQAFCTDCHAALKSRLPGTKLGDAGDFATAHPQFHARVMTEPGATPRFASVSLDDHPRESTGLTFPHALHMAQAGGVARMQQSLGGKPLQCQDCHRADDSGVRFRPVTMERDCQQCHSLAFDTVEGTVRTLRHAEPAQVIADIRDFYAAHPGGLHVVPSAAPRPGAAGQPGYLVTAPPRTAAGAIRAVFSKGGACYDCHIILPPRAGKLDYRVVPVRQPMRFMFNGWFDHSAHRTSSCASCHGDALKTDDSHAILLPGIATCRTCHGGDTARPPLVRSSCVLCHGFHRGGPAPQSPASATLARDLGPVARMDWAGGRDPAAGGIDSAVAAPREPTGSER